MRKPLPELATSFAAITDLLITVPPERLVALRRLAEPNLPMTAYVGLNLPVVVGKLSNTQQQDFAPQSALGSFDYGHKLDVKDFSRMQPRDLLVVARELLGQQHRVQAGSVTDSLRPRFQSGERDLAAFKVRQQLQIVADMLCFDQKLFGSKHTHIALDFVQDRPSPHQAFAPGLHTDEPFRAPTNGVVPGSLFRSYSLRSSLGTEFLCDSVYTSPLALTDVFKAIVKGQITAVPLAELGQWVDKARAAGHWLDSNSNEVMLRSRELTWHRSKRPDRMETSTLLRLNIGVTHG